VGRLPDQHLNLYELRLLASDRLSMGMRFRISETGRKELDDHILGCPECRELLEQEQFLFPMSRRIPTRITPGPTCPSEQQWMEFAAGLHPPAEAQERLEHANSCAYCSGRLQRVSEQFADDLTDEEKNVLNGLASADPFWQKDLASRMQAASSRTNPFLRVKAGWIKVRFLRSGIAVASATLVLAIAWLAHSRPDRAVNRLLSLAYSEQRSGDLRMIGSRYASVEAFRGGETPALRRPTALLEAEVMISKELASTPDNPFWLDAQARADLMEANYSPALASLERASRYEPDNQAIRIDLASAYFLRGEELKRSEDYGRAVDLFGQVLATDPKNEVARFNRAIASERLLLYDQAVQDWHRYLEFDPSSSWSQEARKRLAELEEKINQQKQRSERPLLGPAEFVSLYRDNPENAIKEIDPRIERYFETALAHWIPAAFSNTRGMTAATARNALDSLSVILARKHGDYWLADFLSELRQKPLSRAALPHLTESLRLSPVADLDRARQSAIDAEVAFHKSRNYAGELMAQFESSYADQLAHQVSNCLDEARSRGDSRLAERYPWLRAQLALEAAACTNLNDETARKLASEALSLAKLQHYPSLELRSLTFLAALYQYMGDTSSAWRYSTEGLAHYWKGDYTATRGYSLYAGLDFVAEDTEEWSLDVQVLEEAARFIRDDPDLELRAMQRYRLANALAMTGDFSAAERTFTEARSLFLHSDDGTRKNNFEFEAQIDLAKLELLRSRPENAIYRLEPFRETARAISDEDFVFDYFRSLGLAYFAAGKTVQARQNLADAVGLAEESLGRNHDERERLIWSRKFDQVYRAMVQLSLSGPPRDTLAQWEWFKGASLRGRPLLRRQENVPFDARRVPALSFVVPADTVVVSYAVLPEGTFVWSYTGDQARQYRLTISNSELERLVRRFADHCSRPDSDLATLSAESHELYQKLLGPLEPFLKSSEHLVIEPDQSLWLVPFEALLDREGLYLGDRYAISFSPGLDYLAVSPSWQGVTQDSRIVIAGDPETFGRTPLDDAEEEAKGIARRFRYNELLLKNDAGYGRIAKEVAAAEIFHFSGHAAASPDGVGLVLGDSIMDVRRIRVSEFSHLKLAVLSACNSANGGADVFDNRDSLARVLVGAGVVEVVASRWTVNSRATASLMGEFYAQLLSGKEVSLALREASRKLRRNSEFVHPFYWASFSAFGKS